MSSDSTRAELASFIDAGYPLIGLQTHEEDRAVGLVEFIAQERAMILEVISHAAGASVDGGPGPCLSHIEAFEDPALFILLDFHGALADPTVSRQLRDLLGLLGPRKQTVILVGSTLHVPDPLAFDCVTIDLPLPDAVMLGAELDRMTEDADIPLTDEVRRRAVRALQGLTLRAATLAIRRALGPGGGLERGHVDTLVREKRLILRGTDLLDYVDTPPSLEAVGGLQGLKGWLRERERAFGQEARDFGLPTPKGLLLVGVQGCGKSLTAKAIARTWDLPLARLDFGALFTGGLTAEANLRRVLRLAEALAPVVLWMDELDKIFRGTDDDGQASETLTRVFAGFITWLQEKTAPVFVVATANQVQQLPPELLRKGRFDEIFFVDLPEPSERAQILQIHLEAHGRTSADFDVDALAKATEHFSGAELEQVIVGALYRAFEHDRDLTDEDLTHAATGTVPLYRTHEERIKALREWAKGRARRASSEQRLTDLWRS